MRPAPSPYPTKAEWTIHAHATRVPFSFVDGHAILIPTNNARKPKREQTFAETSLPLLKYLPPSKSTSKPLLQNYILSET